MSAEAGIPAAARQRLEEVRRAGGAFFTSDLSVPELLVLREAGVRPLTQVMGSCFYHVGWQGMPLVPGYAEGIVGVQLNEGSHGWDSHVIEYFAIGTAVKPISDDHTIPPPSFVLTLNDPLQNRLSGF